MKVLQTCHLLCNYFEPVRYYEQIFLEISVFNPFIFQPMPHDTPISASGGIQYMCLGFNSSAPFAILAFSFNHLCTNTFFGDNQVLYKLGNFSSLYFVSRAFQTFIKTTKAARRNPFYTYCNTGRSSQLSLTQSTNNATLLKSPNFNCEIKI